MRLRPPQGLLNTVRDIASWCRQAVEIEEYTVTTLPDPSQKTTIIYVRNEAGGAVPAFNDGTNWRRVTDRAIVS
jgi:hypothetical protein